MIMVYYMAPDEESKVAVLAEGSLSELLLIAQQLSLNMNDFALLEGRIVKEFSQDFLNITDLMDLPDGGGAS